MNRQTAPQGQPRADARDSAAPHPFARKQARRLLGYMLRGCVLSGTGFLLGSCPLLFGTAPLGIGLFAAASAYTWFIGVGLLLSALIHPVGMPSWAWITVYTLCLILRLCIRLLVDPPARPDGRPYRVGAYLSLCFHSLKRNLGLGSPDEETGDRPSRAAEHRLFAEHPFLRMLTAAVSGFAAGLCTMLTGGFHVYDLLGTLSLLVLAPLSTFLLVAVFSEAGLLLVFSTTPLRDIPLRQHPLRGKAFSDRDGGVSRLLSHVHPLTLTAVSVLIICAVFAAGRIPSPTVLPFLTISLPTLLGLLIALSASARLGIVPGLATAVLCGIAAGIRHAPMFILAAGGYALLRYLSHRAGVLGGCTIGAVWCAAVEGTSALVVEFPAILLSVPLCFLTERLWESFPIAEAHGRTDSEVEDFTATVSAAMAAECRAEAQRARLTAISEAFGALSRRFHDLSGQLKHPRSGDLRRMCDEAFGKQCAHCREREVCWGRAYRRTQELQSRMTTALREDGTVTTEDIPSPLLDACPYIDTIVEDLNARYAHLLEALSRSEKTEVFAADYAALASLLGDALEADRLDAETMGGNRAAADRVYDYLTGEGVTVLGVVVAGRKESGRRRVIIRGENLDCLGDRLSDLHKGLEEICGTRLMPPVIEPTPEGQVGAVMTLAPEPCLDTVYAGSTVPATHDPRAPLPTPLTHQTPPESYHPPVVCGDHVALFHTEDAYFYALISDGMGSGEDASLTSEICTMFLQKMLASGNRVEISLRMLDGYIHAKNTGTGDECSATVDLMELDLMDGRAIFSKNGAAPTYVVREGTVYKLRSRTMPIGILKETPPELLRFRMHPGDVVVMVSDGVTQGRDECPWLIELLSAPLPDSMDTLRTDIIRRALSSGSEDDLSAIAIRIEERR